MPSVPLCAQCNAALPPDRSTACPICGYPVRHRGFQGAWHKGYTATPGSPCPYADHRTCYHNGVTFSAAWQRFWEAGRDWAARQRASAGHNAPRAHEDRHEHRG